MSTDFDSQNQQKINMLWFTVYSNFTNGKISKMSNKTVKY